MAIYLVLLVSFVVLPLGQQWLGVSEKTFQMPNRRWAVGPTERCPTCGEAACRRGSLGSRPLTVQVLELNAFRTLVQCRSSRASNGQWTQLQCMADPRV